MIYKGFYQEVVDVYEQDSGDVIEVDFLEYSVVFG